MHNPFQPTRPAIRLTHIGVHADRISFDVSIDDPNERMASANLIARVVAAHPSLPRHTCVNGKGTTFAAVMDRTSLPHVLEHLCIDILTHAAASEGGRATFVGTSEWVNRDQGRAHIELSYDNDLRTIAAFNQAVDEINGILADCGV